jgi:tight adherence protein B
VNGWIAAISVLLAAVPVVWPRGPWLGGGRWRLRRVLAGDGRPGGSARRLTRAVPGDPWWHRRIGTALLLVVVLALAAVLGGPVAVAVAACYGLVGVRAASQRARRRREAAIRREQLDRLGAAAADLRAGLPVQAVLPVQPAFTAARPSWQAVIAGPRRAPRPGRAEALAARVEAAVNLAERTGAPLAELLERVETDARARDRAHRAAAAQAAGSVATAWLLAGLPAGGIALGYAVGADPLAVLLHTPVGAACAIGAVALQLGGLAWSQQIISPKEADS